MRTASLNLRVSQTVTLKMVCLILNEWNWNWSQSHAQKKETFIFCYNIWVEGINPTLGEYSLEVINLKKLGLRTLHHTRKFFLFFNYKILFGKRKSPCCFRELFLK